MQRTDSPEPLPRVEVPLLGRLVHKVTPCALDPGSVVEALLPTGRTKRLYVLGIRKHQLRGEPLLCCHELHDASEYNVCILVQDILVALYCTYGYPYYWHHHSDYSVYKDLQYRPPGLHCFRRGEQHAFDDGEQPVVPNQNQASAQAEQGQIADDDAEPRHTANDDAEQGQSADDEAEPGQIADVDAEHGQTADDEAEQGHTADDEAEQGHTADVDAEPGETADDGAEPEPLQAKPEQLTRAERKLNRAQYFESAISSPQGSAIASAISSRQGSAMASSSAHYQ